MNRLQITILYFIQGVLPCTMVDIIPNLQMLISRSLVCLVREPLHGEFLAVRRSHQRIHKIDPEVYNFPRF